MRLMKKAATAAVVCALSACVLTACADDLPGTGKGTEPTATPSASVSDTNGGGSSGGSSDSDEETVSPTATPEPTATPTPTPAAKVTATQKVQEFVNAFNSNKYYQEYSVSAYPGIKYINAVDGEKEYYKLIDLSTGNITLVGWEDETYEYSPEAISVDGVSQDYPLTLVKTKKIASSESTPIISLQILDTDTVTENGTTYSCVTATLKTSSEQVTAKFYFDSTTMDLKYTDASNGTDSVRTTYYSFKTSFDESILDPTKSGYKIIDGDEVEVSESANS